MWCNNVGTSSAIGVVAARSGIAAWIFDERRLYSSSTRTYTHTLWNTQGPSTLRLFDGRGEMFSSSRHNDRLSFSMHTHTHIHRETISSFSFEKKKAEIWVKKCIEMYRREREISYTIVRPVAFGLAHFSGPAHGGGGGSFSCVSIPAWLYGTTNIYVFLVRLYDTHSSTFLGEKWGGV